MSIRGYKVQNSEVTWCRGFLVLESRCRGFSVLESGCLGFSSFEKMPWFSMLWLSCLSFLDGWCFSTRTSMSQFFGLGFLRLCFFGLGISMSWYMCLHGLVFVFILKTEKIRQSSFNYIVEEYFNYPNLCKSCLHKVCICELE